MADWVAIKTEYINTQISTRALADKYGLTASQVQRRSAREDWPGLREAQRSKTEAICMQKTAEAVADEQAIRIKKLLRIGCHAADQLERCLAAMDEDRNYRAYEIKAVVETALKIRELYAETGGEEEQTQDDGLMAALSARAPSLFAGGDDSGMLPEEAPEEEANETG